MRWNPSTKMVQVCEGGTWYDKEYYDPHWDGYVYNNGVYDAIYFGQFEIEQSVNENHVINTGSVGNPFNIQMTARTQSGQGVDTILMVRDVELPSVRSTSTITISGTHYYSIGIYSSIWSSIDLVADDGPVLNLYTDSPGYSSSAQTKTNTIAITNKNIGALSGKGNVHLRYYHKINAANTLGTSKFSISTIKFNY